MPIQGFSDRARLSRGGHLRLGTKKESSGGKMYPVKSDHFIADFDDPAIAAKFKELYGDTPREVEICFHSNDSDAIFPHWYCCYGSGTGLKCKGNGETATRLMPGGGFDEVECPTPEHCDFAKANGCKQQGMLMFFIRGVPTMKVYQINTTSWNSMLNINSAIKMLQWLRQGRSIAGIWVRLKLVKREVQHDGKKVTIYVMEIDLPADLTIESSAKLVSFIESDPLTAQAAAAVKPDLSKDDLLHGNADEPIEAVASREEPEPVTELLLKRSSEEEERTALIDRVWLKIGELPAKEVRDEIIAKVARETKNKNFNWTMWDTAAIQRLADGLEAKGA